jgi:hypothetical protein
MTKKILNLRNVIAIAICLAGATMFTSCNKDEKVGGTSTSTSTNLTGTGQYFTIEGAQFNEGSLPTGNADMISDVSINTNAINGGSSILTFTSSEKLKYVLVGVEGQEGYYKYELPDVPAQAKAQMETNEIGSYIYEVILQFRQNLNLVNNFRLHLSGVTVSGTTSSAIDTETIEVVEVGTGKLQVSLSWDQLDDVDLHLYEPDGNRICYWNRTSEGGYSTMTQEQFDFYCYLINKYTGEDMSDYSYPEDELWIAMGLSLLVLDGQLTQAQLEQELAQAGINQSTGNSNSEYGELDLDSNAGCSIDGVNNENITYKNKVKTGTYKVAVDLFEKCNLATAGAKYSVTVNYNGTPVTLDNPTGQFDDSNEGDFETESEFVIIGTFTINDNGTISSGGTYSAATAKPISMPQSAKAKAKQLSKK